MLEKLRSIWRRHFLRKTHKAGKNRKARRIRRPHLPPKEALKKRLLDRDCHRWVSEEQGVLRSFHLFIDAFPQDVVKFFEKNPDIVFIKSHGILAGVLDFGTLKTQVILLYPDLIKMLKSALYLQGVAVLAHELGHLFHRHSERGTPTLAAQVEADAFAYRLGFGHELQNVLQDYPEHMDCRVRISYLTSHLLQRQLEGQLQEKAN